MHRFLAFSILTFSSLNLSWIFHFASIYHFFALKLNLAIHLNINIKITYVIDILFIKLILNLLTRIINFFCFSFDSEHLTIRSNFLITCLSLNFYFSICTFLNLLRQYLQKLFEASCNLYWSSSNNSLIRRFLNVVYFFNIFQNPASYPFCIKICISLFLA